MAGNAAFIPVRENTALRGLDNLLHGELNGWFGRRAWLYHSLVWMGIIDGITLMTILQTSRSVALSGAPRSEALTAGLMIYCVFTGIAAGIGVIITMQGAVVGEKLDGTAAWVLSKPVARPAFILAKFLGNLAGILVCMLAIPGLLAYLILTFAANGGQWLPPPGFLAGMGALALNLLFIEALCLMVGALSERRAAVIGIPLAFLIGQQFLIQSFPALENILPWTLAVPGSGAGVSVASALMSGQPVPSWGPVIFAGVLSIMFLLIAVWRFGKAEF
jgi:ABC-type transport system involved in multi-copper enzyme maturation permease subunit